MTGDQHQRPRADGRLPLLDPAPDVTRKRLAIGVLFVAAVFVFLTGIALGGDDSESGSGPDPALDRVAAQLACEDFVADRLKAPSTARFAEAFVTPGAVDVYTVDGAVDAQNSFGVMIRNSYSCTVALSADRARWTLLSLDGVTA